MSILRRIFPLLLTAALLCACVQMPNTPQDELPAPTHDPQQLPALRPRGPPRVEVELRGAEPQLCGE